MWEIARWGMWPRAEFALADILAHSGNAASGPTGKCAWGEICPPGKLPLRGNCASREVGHLEHQAFCASEFPRRKSPCGNWPPGKFCHRGDVPIAQMAEILQYGKFPHWEICPPGKLSPGIGLGNGSWHLGNCTGKLPREFARKLHLEIARWIWNATWENAPWEMARENGHPELASGHSSCDIGNVTWGNWPGEIGTRMPSGNGLGYMRHCALGIAHWKLPSRIARGLPLEIAPCGIWPMAIGICHWNCSGNLPPGFPLEWLGNMRNGHGNCLGLAGCPDSWMLGMDAWDAGCLGCPDAWMLDPPLDAGCWMLDVWMTDA